MDRIWTFRHERGHMAYQGLRFLVVSILALGANLADPRRHWSEIGVGKIVAQAAGDRPGETPLHFISNKLWSD